MGMYKFLLIFLLFNLSVSGQSPLSKLLRKHVSANVPDADSIKFVTYVANAGGTLSSTEKTAIGTLIKQLKDSSLWSSFNAIYPMVGGSAASCKANLKDTTQFNLNFQNSPTCSSNGVAWNGTTQYAKTGITASTALSASSNHLSYYSRSNTQQTTNFDIGANTGAALILLCAGRSSGDLSFYEQGGWYANLASSTINKAALFIGTRTVAGSSNPIFYRNGISVQTAITADGTSGLPALEIYLGARNLNTVASDFCNRQCAWASIGSGLTAAQSLTLYNIVQAFQTTLSRQV